MVTIGQIIQVQEELYEVQQTIKVNPYKVLPSDLSDEIKRHYRVDKIFKKENFLYLVNDITTVEPVYD
jgi:hypothetical protein